VTITVTDNRKWKYSCFGVNDINVAISGCSSLSQTLADTFIAHVMVDNKICRWNFDAI